MRLVDTSAWIEWLMRTDVGRRLNTEFPARADQLVPTIVQLELAVWARRELPEANARRIIADTMECFVVPLDTKTALRAAGIRRHTKLSTADAIIYATALEYDADLLTCDAHFKDLSEVVYIPKAGGA